MKTKEQLIEEINRIEWKIPYFDFYAQLPAKRYVQKLRQQLAEQSAELKD